MLFNNSFTENYRYASAVTYILKHNFIFNYAGKHIVLFMSLTVSLSSPGPSANPFSLHVNCILNR